jgi:ATP-dependent RNA helicase DeaD
MRPRLGKATTLPCLIKTAKDSVMKSPEAPTITFAELGLSDAVVKAVAAIGYESASPIQAATIPALLAGADILGQAQTGTGKTAAFALPILSKIDLKQKPPQALVLVPTRELAIQVAEAFQKYAVGLAGFHVLPIYGGQSYTPQLNALKRGTHVIVGTPGRIMDHMDRGTLSLAGIRTVVLDEADEMLAMGFADAMESILSKTPPERQVALFSATMAPNIKKIAQRHLRKPQEIILRGKTVTAANTRQRYWLVSGMHKLDALTRILEVEPFDAMLVFVRTKQSTVELAERLEARGFAAVALSGDVPQPLRERIVAQLKSGKIDIVVATDVAARGLDVERISHVVNFDVPYDTESYIHRIGRTGRAGRSGEAILFIAPRERNLLRLIERATRQPVEAMSLPSIDDVNVRRLVKFKERIAAALKDTQAPMFRTAIEEFAHETGTDLLTISAALAAMAEGKTPLLLPAREGRGAGVERGADEQGANPPHENLRRPTSGAQATYRLEVGRRHGVLPGNLVGAIANEAKLEGAQINGLDIRSDHSFVRLPADLPESVLARLQAVRVRGQALAISRADSQSRDSAPPSSRPHAKHRPTKVKRKRD